MKVLFATILAGASLLCLTHPAHAAVKGKVYTEKGHKDLVLIAVKRGNLEYSYPGGAVSVLPLSTIKSVQIPTPFDRSAYREALVAQNHGTAAAILVKALLPSRFFFELPNNNQTPLAMEALTLLMRAAEERLLIGNEAAKQEAISQYKVALGFADAIARADWYEGAEEAAFRAVVCMVALDKFAQAAETLEALSIPPETDDAFGWYALARARLLVQEEKWEEALEAGIEAVVFQTKDSDCFPLALILTAGCNEKLDQWHRARDAYFALGSLMKKTAWEPHAVQRLKYILDNKLTAEEEKRGIQQVFFSGREDLNGEAQSLVDAYIEKRREKQQQPEAEK